MFGKGTGGDVMPYVQFFVCKLEPERAFLATFHVAAVLHLYLSNTLCTMGLLTYAFVVIMNLEKKQVRAQFYGFFHVVSQLKEDIKNNNNYVAGVVHDLRNPLTEIYSCTELLTQTLPEHLLNNPDMQ
jgi:signal transduction histidine kinase